METKKRKSKWKRLPIPEETKSCLIDWSIPVIERVRLAEQCRELYSYTKTDMLKTTGISYNQYADLCKVIDSGNQELCERLQRGEISLRTALLEIKRPGYMQERGRYLFLDRVNRIPSEIIYMDSRHILYRYEQNVVLGIVHHVFIEDEERWGYKEMCCLLDDAPYAVDTAINLLKDGYSIYPNLSLHKPAKEANGRLHHHIMAVYGNIPLKTVQEATVSFKVKSDGNMKDLRVSNLRCRAVPERITSEYTGGRYRVVRSKAEIKIINQDTGAVTTTDDEKWLYGLLQDKRDYLKVQSRDSRLCVPICGSVEYLYHICLAVHLYGVPKSEDDLSIKLGKFRADYLSKGNQVDHLDHDCSNNRLSNLIVMTKAQHCRKQSVETSLLKLGLSGVPCFCWLERYDNTAVTMRAGYFRLLKAPEYRVCGVFSINQFLIEAEKFIASVQGDIHIFELLSQKVEDEHVERNITTDDRRDAE